MDDKPDILVMHSRELHARPWLRTVDDEARWKQTPHSVWEVTGWAEDGFLALLYGAVQEAEAQATPDGSHVEELLDLYELQAYRAELIND